MGWRRTAVLAMVLVAVALSCLGCQSSGAPAQPDPDPARAAIDDAIQRAETATDAPGEAEARAALAAADAQIDTYNQGYQAAFDALGDFGSPDNTQAGWLRKAQSLAEAEFWMPKRRAALDSADAQWRVVAGMAAPWYQTKFASVMHDLIPLKLREEAKVVEILSACRKFCEYNASGKATQSGVEAKKAAILELSQEAADISAEVNMAIRSAGPYSFGHSRPRTWDEEDPGT